MDERTKQLYRNCGSRGYDRWFHRHNREFETKLGFFRVQVVNRRFWIIDPDNHPFLSMGICHIAYKGERKISAAADIDPTGYSPYGATIDRRYGGDANAWAAAQVKRLRQWNFNTVGSWASLEMWAQGMPYTVFLGITRYVMPNAWLHGDFPDVFAPEFRQGAEAAAAELCAPRKDDRLLLGYFTDNELDWNGWRRGTSLFDYFMAKSADLPGRQALVAMMAQRYGEVCKLNQAWDVNLTSFDQLNELTALEPGCNADCCAVQCDKDAYLALAAEQYFAVCEKAIRDADPNHMILGVRFAGTADGPVVEACGRHCDIVSYNNYSYDAPAEAMQDIFELTWRPVMITEWSFKAMDAGLPNTKGAAIPVYTQEDRADGYERYVTEALSLPFVVGLHWFQYTDQPVIGRDHDGENSNYGVVDTDDEPHFTLVDRMRQVNGRAIDIAKASPNLQEVLEARYMAPKATGSPTGTSSD